MKTLIIKHRAILERTGFRKYPYRERNEFIVTYGDRLLINDCPFGRIRVPFLTILCTRSKKRVAEFASNLGRTADEQRLRLVLEFEVLNERKADSIPVLDANFQPII